MAEPPAHDEEAETPKSVDPAILSLVRVLARQAAREDHEAAGRPNAQDAPFTDKAKNALGGRK